MFELEGKIALVTGAGQGMGVGIVRALASQGASVALNDIDEGRAKDTAARLARDTGGTIVAVAFDVTDPRAVDAGVVAAADAMGDSIDILVNNAGVPEGMSLVPFRSTTPDDWRRYVDLNLYGSLNCIRAVVDPMCDRGWGRIVQISSAAGRVGTNFGISLYGASKAGIDGFIRHLSQEVAGEGVTANTLSLGLMENAAAGLGEDAAMVAALAAQVPVGRLGEPDDVGAAVAFIASSEAAWLTGQTVSLNGGQLTT